MSYYAIYQILRDRKLQAPLETIVYLYQQMWVLFKVKTTVSISGFNLLRKVFQVRT